MCENDTSEELYITKKNYYKKCLNEKLGPVFQKRKT